MARAGRGSDQFMLRLLPGMRERIKAAAEANGRSMNAEIVKRIEESYELMLEMDFETGGYRVHKASVGRFIHRDYSDEKIFEIIAECNNEIEDCLSVLRSRAKEKQKA